MGRFQSYGMRSHVLGQCLRQAEGGYRDWKMRQERKSPNRTTYWGYPSRAKT